MDVDIGNLINSVICFLSYMGASGYLGFIITDFKTLQVWKQIVLCFLYDESLIIVGEREV